MNESTQNVITQLHQLKAQQILSPLAELKKEVESLKQLLLAKQPIEFMSRKELAELLDTNSQTISNWTREGKLKMYGIGARRYYKRNEVEQALIELN
ncbi:helix-turn-helix domain-containing protein [Confluentibacter sediminis]|uniref:helix-turn-helix domain-containing protein n=1 Tax=Confluentibacter sediminis TaxID=2219045 RepID=UPI000DAD6BCE|nr:helix-turn-helix domain-containing protein [Confluentibacter sediminis]